MGQWEGVPWDGARKMLEACLCGEGLDGEGLVGWMVALMLLEDAAGWCVGGGRAMDALLRMPLTEWPMPNQVRG